VPGTLSRPDAAGSRPTELMTGPPRVRVVAATLFVVLAIPLLVAVVSLHRQPWNPVLDLAMTEMRVRDVGTSHSPLIGLVGRIGPYGPNQGSHPGPISFWALAPFYRVFGSSPWALEVAAASLNLLAIAAALWIASRRGGLPLALAVAAMLAVVLRFFGPSTLTQAWNPYMPVLWWLVFLLACWSVLCGDFVMLPVAALAGAFCMQTEVAYVGLITGLGAITFAIASIEAYRGRTDRKAFRRFIRWSAGAFAALVVVWIPPVIDQIRHTPGNFSTLWTYFFTHPSDQSVGLRTGVEALVGHMSPIRLLTGLLVPRIGTTMAETSVPGTVLLVAWLASAIVAWRARLRDLVRFDLVIGAALVLGVVSTSRIFGIVWYYLIMWAWVVGALMVIAIGWTVAVMVGRRLPAQRREGSAFAGSVALAALLVGYVGLVTASASSVKIPDTRLSMTLGGLVAPTADALAHQPAPAGVEARYLITWHDPVYIGSLGFGLLNELDRRGFHVGTTANQGPGATRQRVLAPSQATAVVHLSIGDDIEVWRAKPGVREVAYVDLRSATEKEEYSRLRSEVIDELRTAGLQSMVPDVDGNVFGAAINPATPEIARPRLTRMLDLGLPQAIFIAAPGTES
jgi:hypothetical protein